MFPVQALIEMFPFDFGKHPLGKNFLQQKGISFKFNEWEEFIKVAQKMYSEYTEIYTCKPCILDEGTQYQYL